MDYNPIYSADRMLRLAAVIFAASKNPILSVNEAEALRRRSAKLHAESEHIRRQAVCPYFDRVTQTRHAPDVPFVDKTGKRKLCAFGQKRTTMFHEIENGLVAECPARSPLRWRLASAVLVYLVVKYLRWKLRRIVRQLDAAEVDATRHPV
jgi:hypothetical protein